MVAAQMGLEPGVNGQGYLIPYKTTCTFVPGWKGIVDIANRSGRSSVWTGAVFVGDEFDYAMGDRPFITHKPGRSCSSLITANGGNTITKGQPLAARPKTFKPDFEIEHTKVSYVPTLLAWRLGIFLVVMFVIAAVRNA